MNNNIIPVSTYLNMEALTKEPYLPLANKFKSWFGNNWPEVPCREWEYICAALYSDLKDNMKVLDMGCGHSVFRIALAKLGAEVTAVDITDVFSRRQQDFLSNVNIEELFGQCLGVELKEKSFDRVFCMSSIEHFYIGTNGDIEGLKKMKSWLKDDGILILTTDFCSFYHDGTSELDGLWNSGYSGRYYDKEHLVNLVNEAGLKFKGTTDFDTIDWSEIYRREPKRWLDKNNVLQDNCRYTEAILVLEKG